MKLLGNRISFRNYSKEVKETGRRHISDIPRHFGQDITNVVSVQGDRDQSIDPNRPKTVRKTILKIRSSSFNGRYKQQIPKPPVGQYEKQITGTLLSKNQTPQKLETNVFLTKLRTLTIDWIVDVHSRLQLCDQTLFLFFQYFDQYCSKTQVNKSNLRLAALTCLWIASKFQQTYSIRAVSFSNLTDGAISPQDMKMTEGEILQALDYQLVKSTPLQMLYIALEHRRGTQQQSLCKFVFELCYAYNLTNQYKPSLLVIAALNLCENVFKQKTQYRKYKQVFGISHNQLVCCFKELVVMVERSTQQSNISSLRRKYEKTKNHEVSKLKFELK